jgi:two-component system chemotaxis response regulator CheB
VADELIAKVKAAAGAPLQRIAAIARPPTAVAVLPGVTSVDVVVIGLSTGGPQGLKVVIPAIPAACPAAIAIVLHMPVGYTEMYARKLDELALVSVKEAEEGDEVLPGRALLAPAGRHLTFRRDGARVLAHLDLRPLDTPHRPAVDVLFQSAAEVYGARTLGVVMTGMGADGRDGATWIKARGGRILTEAEESCVVYGMPRAVVEAGLSDASAPLEDMARAIMERL